MSDINAAAPASQNPAVADPETCAEHARKFMDDWRFGARASGISQRVRGNWNKYYARDDGNAGWADDLYPEGDEGEKVRMRVNVARNLIRHIVSMTVATRPVIDPKAINTDVQSIKQTEIGRSVADHYLKTQKVYQFVDDAVEFACATAPAYIHCKWDPQAGGTYAAPPDPNAPPGPDGQPPAAPQPRGDCDFSVLSFLDLAFDLRVTSWRDVNECVVREWSDKYDLAATYPERAEEIMKAPTRGYSSNAVVDDELPTPGRYAAEQRPSNLIEVGTYYHKKTPSCPDGRRLLFILASGEWLEDDQLRYRKLPIIRITAAEAIGSAIGYSPMTSLAGPQESLDKAMSCIATRIYAHGVANLLVKRGSAPESSQLTGGLNVIEADSLTPGDEPVKVLELLKIPPELFKFTETVTQFMESDSGVNAVVRGNPPPGLDAGVAIAQFQAMAVQFVSSIEASYAEAIEDIVLFIFDALKTHSASIPRVVQLAGKSKRESVQEFYGSQLESIGRVVADMGNPLSRTAAGRAMIADYLRNSGTPTTAEQFMQVINSGNLETATEDITSEMNLIRQENEMLADGNPVSAMRGENHALHIKMHRGVLSNPDVKFSPVADNVEEHMQQHEQLWGMGDPLLGIAMGDPRFQMGYAIPPPPISGPPGGSPGAQPAAPPGGGHESPGAPSGGPSHPPMHAPPKKGPGPGELPKVMQPPVQGMPQH